jgi:hypothetical protein
MPLRVHLLTVGAVQITPLKKKERRMRTPTLAALATACAVAVSAAPADASSIVYTKSDNVWITTPDGSYQKAVTTDGTAANRYQAPGQLDDGTIVAARPSPRAFYALRQDGSLRNAPLLAPGNSCGTGPLDLDVTPDSGLIVFQYVHSDYCFNPTPGNGPRSRVTFAFSDVPTGPSTFIKHDNWTAPRWTPGTDYASMVAIGGGSIGLQGGGTVSPWLSSNPSVELIKSFDITRTGNRVLVETTPPAGSPSRLVLWQNNGVPKTQNNTGTALCTAESFAAGDADPRWSPDGTQIAWEGPAGVYVSPAPVVQGTTCVLQPRLVAAGGHDPAWGAADAQRPADPPPPPPPPPPGGGGNTGGDGGSGGNGGNNGGDTGGNGGSTGGDTGSGGNGGNTGGNGGSSDRTPPAVTVGLPARVKLAAALRKGVTVPVTVSEQSSVTGTLLIAGTTRRKLGLAAAPLKVASGRADGAGQVTLKLKFTAKAMRRLRNAKSAKLTLQVVATDAAGNQTRTARKLTIKR